MNETDGKAITLDWLAWKLAGYDKNELSKWRRVVHEAVESKAFLPKEIDTVKTATQYINVMRTSWRTGEPCVKRIPNGKKSTLDKEKRVTPDIVAPWLRKVDHPSQPNFQMKEWLGEAWGETDKKSGIKKDEKIKKIEVVLEQIEAVDKTFSRHHMPREKEHFFALCCAKYEKVFIGMAFATFTDNYIKSLCSFSKTKPVENYYEAIATKIGVKVKDKHRKHTAKQPANPE